MKLFRLALIALPIILIAAGAALGITPGFIVHGPGVAAGIGAKLLCSAEYVMNSDRQQAFDDVAQYSPLLGQLSVAYQEESQSVTASLWGLKETTATFVPGLGCAIEYPDVTERHSIAARASEPSDAPWPAGSRVTTINPQVQALVADLVQQDNNAGLDTRALLVVHRGAVVAEVYAHGADAATPLLGWSMAKSFTAITLGNLEMQGLIDLQAAPDFAEWSSDARSAIRINHLLTMTDGLAFSERYNPGDDSTAMLFTEPSASAYVLQKPAAHTPGSRFNYSSGTANLLSRLHADTLGSPQAAYDHVVDTLFAGLGFQHAVLEMDASGHFVGSSYLYAPARDWARMGQLMLNGGTLNGHRLVTEEWVQRATTPNTSNNEKAYGYLWWLNAGDSQLRFADLPADAFFANGNRQQIVMVLPSAETVIVRLGWTSGGYPVNDNFRQILQQITAMDPSPLQSVADADG